MAKSIFIKTPRPYSLGVIEASKTRTGNRPKGWALIALKEDFSGMIK